MKKSRVQTVVIVLLAIIAIAAVLTCYFFYKKYAYLVQNPEVVSQQETDWLVDRVGKLIVLPEEETPVIATVSDKNKLTGQAFFTNAENGDKILIYKESGKAFLYRPSGDIVVEAMPLSEPSPVASVSATASITPSPQSFIPEESP